MPNPFRSEGAAFRLVLVLAAAFAAIVVADQLLGRWAALAVAVIALAAATWWLISGGQTAAPVQRVAPPPSPAGELRILVIANETVGGETLRRTIREKAGRADRTEVLVVSPTLMSQLRQWASDVDPARREAQERLDASLALLREGGIDARGEVGATEPLQAIEDALRTFGADEIVISTHPAGSSRWLEDGVVDAARERFAVPVTHVVVDPETHTEELQ
jgi:hypothetical protein